MEDLRDGRRVRLLHARKTNGGCCKDCYSAVAHEIASTVIGHVIVVPALEADVGSAISRQILVHARGMPIGLAVPGGMRISARNVGHDERKCHQG